ncbi:uncharacterized protein TrAtP1_012515 [Trichoderma atroviride]|uniref:uncharacterized protein n=1 Tax=Hypocrea atroviridis TaxID=63577 RepID=UPI003319360A|nr:hypothetical protein TrAtP1_012515 [Trichoderma atroviride]
MAVLGQRKPWEPKSDIVVLRQVGESGRWTTASAAEEGSQRICIRNISGLGCTCAAHGALRTLPVSYGRGVPRWLA